MIPVKERPAPPDFEVRVATPGRNALRELCGDPQAPKRRGRRRPVVARRVEDLPASSLPTYRTRALPILRSAYGSVCAYLGLWIDEATGWATVDQFRPKSKHPALAYTWSNPSPRGRRPGWGSGCPGRPQPPNSCL